MLYSYINIWVHFDFPWWLDSPVATKKHIFNKKLYLHWGFLHQSNPPSEWCGISLDFPQTNRLSSCTQVPWCHRWFRGSRIYFGHGEEAWVFATPGGSWLTWTETKKRFANQPGDVLGRVFSAQTCDVILLRLEDWRHRIAVFLYSFTNVSCHWSKITFLDLTNSPGCFHHNFNRISCGRFLK